MIVYFFITAQIQLSRNDHIYSKLDIMQHNIHLVLSVMIIALLSAVVNFYYVWQFMKYGTMMRFMMIALLVGD